MSERKFAQKQRPAVQPARSPVRTESPDEWPAPAVNAQSWDFTEIPVFPARPSPGGMPVVESVLAAEGSPLDKETTVMIGPWFGHDFSRVRVHTGPDAQLATQSIGAAAFTFDRHIVLGAPSIQAAGRELLAHELAHVIQQGDADRPTRVSHPQETSELAADRAAGAVVTGRPAHLAPQHHLAGTVMRQPPGHARGYAGEQGMGFYGYPAPEWALIEGPSGAKGHGVTTRGFDGVAVRVQGDFEIHIIDNKSLARSGNVSSASALTENLRFNLDTLITKVNGAAFNDFPQITQVRATLTQARAALNTPGAQLPPHVQLIVTNFGGESTGVTASLAARGVRFRDLNAPPPTQAPPAGPAGPGAKTGQSSGPPAAPAEEVAPLTPKPPDPAKATPAPGTVPGEEPATHAPAALGDAEVPGHSSQAAVHVGVGVASLAVGWLAARLKERVDKRISQRQVDAFLHIAKQRINANPDDALKKMMAAPDATVYAWIYLDSTVITFFGADSESAEPAMSDSSPLIDLGPIDYAYGPADNSFIGSLPPRISGGGHHMTLTHTMVIDIPLQTPPIEEMIAYAKTRNLPLDDLLGYANQRYLAALSSYENVLDVRQKISANYQTATEIYQKLLADFHAAQKNHNVELQKLLAGHLLSVAHSMKSITDQLEPTRDSMQKSDKNVKHWEHILDLIKSARP